MTEPDVDEPIGKNIEVPFDHTAPELGTGSIYFEFGAPYDETKPVVFIIIDAQQFYVRQGEVAKLQQSKFGDSFNVVGIVGRGTSAEFIEATQGEDGQTNWMKAWRIFNYEQWLADIDAVRQAILGDDGKILIYGESGGALLSHQYLAQYGKHVSRAFTRAVVHPFLVGSLGLNSDRFWQEIGEYDPSLHAELGEALARHAGDRSTLVMTLQRQNFFVPPDQLQAARAELIRALAAGDEEYYGRVRQEYEVEAVREIMGSAEAIPIRVRLFEFLNPADAQTRLGRPELYPDLEVQANISKPLLALCAEHKIPVPDFPLRNLHNLDSEVLVLAGRWDHVVDYRTSIALAASYPRHSLFIADDDHMFKRFEDSGFFYRMLQIFLQFGLDSAEFQATLEKVAAHRWLEP